MDTLLIKNLWLFPPKKIAKIQILDIQMLMLTIVVSKSNIWL